MTETTHCQRVLDVLADGKPRCLDCGKFSRGPYCPVCSRAEPGQLYCITGFYTREDGRVYANLWRNRYQQRQTILRSRLVAAIKVGRMLRSDEVAHHVNADKSDDRLANLEAMASRAHRVMHGFETVRMRDADRRCAGCGVGLDDRTVNCLPCSNRHGQRRRRGERYGTYVPAKRQCNGCDTNHDDVTPGCETCAQRHRVRRRRGAAV